MFISIWIEANSYLQTTQKRRMIPQNNPDLFVDPKYENNEVKEESGNCFCPKKQCMLGIASIAIGIVGFVIASLL